MNRRHFLAMLGATAASGCTGSYFGNALSSITEIRERRQKYPRTRAEVDAIPYASLGVQLEGGLKSILILAHYDNDQLIWVSANRESLVTRHGRIVRTVGLTVDLMGVWGEVRDPLQHVTQWTQDVEISHRDERDFQKGPTDIEPGVAVESKFRYVGTEQIEILERRYALDHWRESVSASKWNWKKENHYWIERSNGLVWRSVQWLHPDLPALTLETLKKPA